MARKKATGPITATGKLTVSKNALKHGATSKRLLNDDENTLYAKLIDDLSTQYVSSNPLVKFQIERIARINIQLLRIQNIIDATFEISRIEAFNKIEPPDHSNDIKDTGVKDHQLAYQVIHCENTRKIYTDLANELIANNYHNLETATGFLKHCPRFCNYLHEGAQRDEVSIERYIQLKFPVRDNSFFTSDMDWNNAIEEMQPSFKEDLSLENAIKNTTSWILKNAAKWLVDELELIQAYESTLAKNNQSMGIKIEAAMPDLDQLDRLMRYQTTLQRQLSTAMGELIAITKI